MLKKIGGGCLGLIGLFVVVIAVIAVIAIASGGSDSKSADSGSSDNSKSSDSSGSTTKKSDGGLNADQGAVNKVQEGKSYRLGDFKIQKGWKIHNVGYGMGYEVKNLAVENTTSDDHGFSVNIKLHKGAKRIVSNINCFAQEAHPGEIVNVDCVPDGAGAKYDYVTIENSF